MATKKIFRYRVTKLWDDSIVIVDHKGWIVGGRTKQGKAAQERMERLVEQANRGTEETE